jgi:hypothetical protein
LSPVESTNYHELKIFRYGRPRKNPHFSNTVRISSLEYFFAALLAASHYLETAMIDAIQHSQPIPYPKMPIKPNGYWMITDTRDQSQNPPTKLVLEQSYLH